MKFNVLLFVLLYTSVQMYAQNEVEYSASLYGTHNFEVSKDISRTFNTTSFALYNDTMVIENKGIFRTTNGEIYEPSFGFVFQLNAKFPLADRWSINTGLGVHYQTYTVGDKFIEASSEMVSSDTVHVRDSDYEDNNNATHCDEYSNTIDELGFDPKPSFTNVNLIIPIAAEYAVIKEKLFIEAGVNIQTPLYTNRKADWIIRDHEEVNGTTICTFILEETEDKSKVYYNKFQLLTFANIRYKVTPGFSIDLGASYHLNNVMDVDFRSHEYYPIQMRLGVTQRLKTFYKSNRQVTGRRL